MKPYRCPRCNTPVEIPEDRPGALCPKCRSAVMRDEVGRPRRSRPATLLLRAALITALLAVIGVWLYVGPLAPEPGLNLERDPRAANVTPRRFSLWELHAEDTTRIVEVVTDSGAAGSQVRVNGPSLLPSSEIVALEFVGGRPVDQTAYEDAYRGTTYRRTRYKLLASRNQYGYDMWVHRPPHLHINGENRLISIGIDPTDFYEQAIIAVAIPVDARIKRIFDHQPYQHVTLAGWDVFYYDVTNIQTHVSIHITYRPGDEAPPLDWTKVDATR